MKHLVFGGNGLLGYSLRLALIDEEVVTIGRDKGDYAYFDLNEPMQIYRIMEDINPDVVHICAYAAGVDWSEDNPVESFYTNVTGISHILFAARRVDAKVTFPSSSYVFAGGMADPYTESDVTSPINVYGRHKEILEENVRSLFPGKHIIYRTVGLFGYEPKGKKNFVYQILRTIENDEPMIVPADQFMNPIFVNNVAKAVVLLGQRRFSGTINLAGDINLSKYEWARMIADRYGKENLILPVPSETLGQSAPRPSNACLSTLKYQRFSQKYLKFDLDRFLGML